MQSSDSGTETTIEKSGDLDERAVRAKESEDEVKTLIEDFMPFLRSRAARYAARGDDDMREDMISVAMIAFYEAIRGYDKVKGHFFPFANRVVASRLIDHLRKAQRNAGKTVYLDDDDPERQTLQSDKLIEISVNRHNAERRREYLVEEIEQFKAEMAPWGITMDSLVKGSPKHSELRATYGKILSRVLGDPDIMQTIQLKRYYPVKAIQKITGLPQKKVERARTYILSSLIIKTGDYDLLSDYIDEGGRGKR